MKQVLSIDASVKKRQSTAADPALSAWVGANAGSGKTYVLSRRVIRLLLSGADPGKILCLTFTKAAAAEMSERVFSALAQWSTAGEADLRQEIATLTGRTPTDEQLREARRLFAKALETPGGLKIQTIHAFCERLLHQFPVEANVAGHFEVLDDVAREQLLREAERDVLLKAVDDPNGPLAQALSDAILNASEMGFQKALRAFLTREHAVMAWIEEEGIEEEGGVSGALDALRRHFGVEARDTLASLQEQMLELPNFPPAYLERLRQALEASSSNFQKQGVLAAIILSERSFAERYQAMLAFFLTKKNEPRKITSFASVAILTDFPDLEDRLIREQERLAAFLDRQKAFATIEASGALFTLGSAVAQSYRAKKIAAGVMDFDDLIDKAANLLETPDAAAWVHYKLDQGLDHILVDEAQDTSPRQWDVIRHLADEFFSGASARAINRTLFAVGDEKQSIYSFQGASPEKFDTMRRYFEKRAEGAQKRFEKVALSLSFRSTADVLGAVDIVCGSDSIKTHLSGDYIDHTAARQNQPGFVELWKPFAKPTEVEHSGPWWQPLDHPDETSEEVQLAEKMALVIKTMLERGERLEGTGARISAGDILILTRKRGAQVNAINRALKACGIPVAGSDRLKLMDHIAILDLLALTDFVLLSEDDLALAGLLKSPLVGLCEDDLFILAHERCGTLWNELFIRAQKDDRRFQNAYERLEAWRRAADFTPPYDFYLRVLSRDRGRYAFLGALGAETNEVLEAFLDQVRLYEQSEVPTLQGFIAWFRNGSVEIKRDMEAGRGEVRVMTVHGAKGLEAPIVFLVDGGTPVHSTHQPEILGLGEEGGGPFIWKRPAEHKTKAQSASIAREQSASIAEYYRLLYVAMTRARDRLYIASTASDKGIPPKQGWFEVAFEALSTHPRCREIKDEAGESIAWRWQASEARALEAGEETTASEELVHPPAWLAREATPARGALKQLTPSRSGGIDDEVESPDPASATPFAEIAPVLRGLLMHRLLEHLPGIDPDKRAQAARRYLESNLEGAEFDVRETILGEVLGVLENPETQFLMTAPDARCEVALCGTVEINGKVYKVRGTVDRLIVSDDRIHIIDFKTNRRIPQAPSETPLAYRRQLALYCALLRPLYPNRRIQASLLWTNGPLLMPLDEDTLTNALEGL